MVELSENAQTVAESRYFWENENWEKLTTRVGIAIAANEKDKKWNQIFAEQIFDMNFIPGGRILRNSGRVRQSLLNCACLPISDSIEAIGDTLKNALILWKYGAGLGIDFSPLREKDKPLISGGGKSSGMLSFIDAIDYISQTIETGGQRRSGLLAMCKVSHPQIYDFINAKLQDGKLSRTNLSVAVDHSFLSAVEENKNWDLEFAGQKVKTIKARDLWNLILDSMINTGDPGLINYDNLTRNNSYYFANPTCTNLCGELPLPPYGMCCLGNLVLPSFLSSGGSTNWKKLESTIFIAVRFLDNVLDVNYFPIRETEQVTKDSRRIGLGVSGLHDYLMAKQARYGSEKAILEIERLFKFIRDTAYRASISLSSEKGAFPRYSKTEYCNASFIRKLPAKIRIEIKDYGIRNCSLISCPPSGTTSLIADVSSGIEPIFSLAYKRIDRVSERYYIHPRLLEYINSNEKIKPEWLVDVSDLTPEDHLETQATIQRYLDNSISKTINCPSTITSSKLSKLLLEYISDLVGVMIYVDGSKKGQVLNKMNMDEIKKYIVDGKIESSQTEKDVECVRGTCEI